MLRPLIVAFSTYSRIPMPQFEWREEDMRYSMAFFPLVGVAAGGALMGWIWLCERMGITGLLRGTVAAAVPLLITGGIHLDGLMDTTDALASHKPMQKKLEILKDSNVGAFAVMACCLYLLLYAGAMSAIADVRTAGVAALGCVASRSMSALALIYFKKAREGGMLGAFAKSAARGPVTAAMAVFLALSLAGMIALRPLAGGVAALACCGVFAHYRIVSYREFGGVTGDLAGYFLTLCELCTALAAAVLS